jgi:hypothetical protein
MISLPGSDPIRKCTVIETLYGEVKLIKRRDGFPSDLITLNFSNLEDCLEYAHRNQIQINVVHSGKKKKENEDNPHPSYLE